MSHCYIQLLQIMVLTISMDHSQVISGGKIDENFKQSQNVWHYV